MKIFELLGTIAINNSDANKAIDTTVGRAENSGSKITSVFKKIGTAVVAGLAVDKIKDFGLECINATSDAEALESQFEQVFGKMKDTASTNLKGIADDTGMLTNRMKGSYTQIAAFAKTTGMDTKDALDLSNRAMVAVADSAAFYDRTLEDTTESLQSFLKGNFENDAALGLSCTETTRNAAANKLFSKSYNELSEAQKQLTLLQMVEDANKTSGALGQAARESETWTNQLGNLKQSFTDFMAELGKPILSTAVKVVSKVSKAVQDLSGRFRSGKNPVQVFMNKINTLRKWLLNLGDYASGKFKPILDKLKKGFQTVSSDANRLVKRLGDIILKLTGAKDATTLAKNVIDRFKNAVNVTINVVGSFYEVLKDVGTWFINSPSAIKAVQTVIGGLAGAYIACKVALMAMNAQQKIKAVLVAADLIKTKLQIAHLALQEGATIKAALAQAELNAAMNLNPVMLLVTGVGLLVGALVGLSAATQKETENQYELTEAQKKNMEAISKRTKSIKEMREAAETEASGIQATYGNYQRLWNELKKNVDANGKIKKGYQDRAKFITSTLSDALGIEISITDNVVDKYKELEAEIDNVILKKKAEAIQGAYDEYYNNAVKERANALKEVTKQQEACAEADQKVISTNLRLRRAKEALAEAEKGASGNAREAASELGSYQKAVADAKEANDKAKKSQEEANKSLRDAKKDVSDYNATIKNYEGVGAAIESGNAEKINTALLKIRNNYKNHNQATVEQLKKQNDDAQAAYNELLKLHKEGNAGITKQDVKDAKAFADITEKTYDKAVKRAKKHGEENTQAYADGKKSKKGEVTKATKEISEEGNKNYSTEGSRKAGEKNIDEFNAGQKSKQGEVNDTAKSIAKTSNSKLKADTHTSGQNFVQGFINGMKSLFSGVVTAAKGLVNRALNTVKKTQSEGSPSKKTAQSGRYFAEGFINGVAEKTSQVVKTVQKLGTDALKGLSSTLDEHSPSKKTEKSGLNFVLGFANGVEKNIKTITKSIYTLSKTTLSTLKDTMKEDDYKDKGKKIVEKLSEGFESKMDKFLDKVKSLRDKMNDALDSIYSKRDSLSDTLSSVDLYTKDSDTGEITLTNFAEQTKDIKQYSRNINKLKGKVSDELMGKIIEMDAEEGLEFTNKLLSLSGSQLKKYNRQYTELLNTGNSIAKEYYAKEVRDVKEKYADKIQEQFEKVVKKVSKLGQNAVEGFMKSFGKNSKVNSTLTSFCNNIVKKIKQELQIHSPSKVFENEVGNNIVLGIAKGIMNEENSVVNALINSKQKWIDSAYGNYPAGNVTGTGSSSSDVAKAIIELKNSLYDIIADVLTDKVQLKFDGREVGRVVKKYC